MLYANSEIFEIFLRFAGIVSRPLSPPLLLSLLFLLHSLLLLSLLSSPLYLSSYPLPSPLALFSSPLHSLMPLLVPPKNMNF
jgi:hypothetical protein